MRLLLDSHVLLWALGGSPRLTKSWRKEIGSAENEVLVSAATIWELEIKLALGRLDVAGDLMEEVRAAAFSELSVAFEHARRAARLPAFHKDPFDRLLVAQALVEGLTLVTADPQLGRYGAATL